MFNWDEFRNGKVAVNCDTEEKAKEFVEECFKRDINYFDRSKETDWYNHKENMCYCTTGSNLCYGSKSFFIGDGYKIIKWESEKMKFKVGDKVRVINNGLTFNTHSMANEWLREIENPKPYDYGNLPKNGFVGIVRGIVKAPSYETPTLIIEIGSYSYLILESGVELIEPQTEFTFQEVIARNIPGVYVNCSHPHAKLKEVEIQQDGIITLRGRLADTTGIGSSFKFKLQEPKRKYVLYGIEHQENGKVYFFRSRQNRVILDTTLVICNTSKGKSYGRAVQRIEKELTEEEYLKYKECWRA